MVEPTGREGLMAIYQPDRWDAALGKHLKVLLIFFALLNSHCSSGKIAKTRAQDPHKSPDPVASPKLLEENTAQVL